MANLVLPFQFPTQGKAENSYVGEDFQAIVKYLGTTPFGSVGVGTIGHIPYYAATGSALSEFPFGTANQFLGINKTASSIEWKTLPYVNVVEYGADNTGVADSSAAFAAAYAAIPATGGTLWIPAGTYLCSSAGLKPKQNTTILGAGQRATIINWTHSGFFLDNTDTGTIMHRFSVIGMTVNCTNASGNHFCRFGTYDQPFDESNQHIEFVFQNLLIAGHSPIIANTVGMQLNTFIRTRIEHCIFLDFDTCWNFQKFDEAYVAHNMLESESSYALWLHNDTGDVVSDESTFIDNHIVVTSGSIAGIFIDTCENIRFFNTYMDASGGLAAVGWKLDSVHNMTIDGATLNSETKIFDLTDVRSLTIKNVQLQNPDQSPAPTASVSFSYGSTDNTGTGGPFQQPNFGLIRVEDCGYQVANAFKGLPGVSIGSDGKYGAGKSYFNGVVSDVTHLTSSQVFDRNGTTSLLKEPVILSPFSSNTFLNGSSITGISVVADSNASAGYALKVPVASANIFLDLTYPGDVIPGAYEIIARVRAGGTATTSSIEVVYDSVTKENYSGIDLTTSYKIINARFNFAPAGSTTLSLRFTASSSQDLYVDYIILRPCTNSLAFQTYVAPDISAVGTSTTPGFKVIYASAAPTTGTWAKGDLTLNTSPTNAGNVGWTCTAAGSPGTWKVFGVIGFSLSPSLAVVTASDGTLANSATTTTEIGYVSGVTSSIQTQLNARATNTEAFVTIGNTGGLTAERALTGTSNQISVTDNGANSTVVLSTPQDIHTAATPTFASETLTATSNQLVLGTTRTATLTAPTPATASRTYTFPDQGASYSVVASEGTQTVNGVKTFGSNPIMSALTASAVVVTASDKSLGSSLTTVTEVGYVHGVTSDIQTQLNAKAADSAVVHNTGTENVGGAKTFTTQLIGKGTATNDDAAAGYIGEYVVGSQSTATNFPTSPDWGDGTSISLTAGDWDVSAVLDATINTATWTRAALGISTTSGNSTTGLVTGDNRLIQTWASSSTTPTGATIVIPTYRISLSTTTTVYLKLSSTYSAGQSQYQCRISARRVR
jgi:hypothetical protein